MTTEHATVREIRDQPAAVEAVLDELSPMTDRIAARFEDAESVCLVGCGTSYYLSQTGAALLNREAVGFAFPGSEVFMSPDQVPESDIDLIIPVSRSGESTETVRGVETLRDRYPEASVVAVTCTDGSAIDDLADATVVSPEGDEESVVMTKSFTSMLAALEYCSDLAPGGESVDADGEGLADDMEAVLTDADPLAETLGTDESFERFVFLGSGEYYGLAAEAMLKLEELTLSWTKAYHPLEFRHGPKSIADDRTLVSVFVPNRRTEEYRALLDDVRDLGTETLAVGTDAALSGIDAGYEFSVPDRSDGPSLSLYMPLFQLLGYYRAVSEGLDPDDPKNLTQVVRLE